MLKDDCKSSLKIISDQKKAYSMKTFKKLLACISLLIFGVGITGSNFIQANQVKADTDYITPSEPWRYKYNSAYYSSSYYQDVWNSTINSWIVTDFIGRKLQIVRKPL